MRLLMLLASIGFIAFPLTLISVSAQTVENEIIANTLETVEKVTPTSLEITETFQLENITTNLNNYSENEWGIKFQVQDPWSITSNSEKGKFCNNDEKCLIVLDNTYEDQLSTITILAEKGIEFENKCQCDSLLDFVQYDYNKTYSSLDNFSFINDNQTTLNENISAWQMEYNNTAKETNNYFGSSFDSDYNIINNHLIIWTTSNGIFYKISYHGNEDIYSKYLPSLKEFLNSIKFVIPEEEPEKELEEKPQSEDRKLSFMMANDTNAKNGNGNNFNQSITDIKSSSDSYLNYTNHNNGFTIKYSTDWSIDNTEYVCTDLSSTKNVLTLLHDRNKDTNTNSRILFFIEDIQTNVSNFELNSYAFQRLNFYKDFGNIVQFDTNSKINNKTAYKIVLEQNPTTSIMDNGTISSSILIGEIGTLLDSKVYRITYTIDKTQNDNFLPILDQIINSFTTINITDSQKDNKTPFSWDSYNLKVGNNKYPINYDMKGLGNSLIEIKPLISKVDLRIKVDAPNDGYLLIEIPRKLLDSKLQNKTDYKFHISNDNKPNTPYEEISSNSNYRILKIQIDDEDRILLIGGSKIDTGRPSIINCNDIILSPITVEQKENEIKTISESLNETVNLNETTNNPDKINTFNISNTSSIEINDEQQIDDSQGMIPESKTKSPALDQNIQTSNNKTSIMKPSTEIAMKVQLEKHEFMDNWYQMSDFTFVASNTSKLCPSANCEYKLEGGEMQSEFIPGERALIGKFKVDTGESTKILNMRADWKAIEERETANGEIIQVIEGDLGIGRDEFNPEHKYEINGTLTSDNEGYLLEITDINSNNKDEINSSGVNCIVLPDGNNYCP